MRRHLACSDLMRGCDLHILSILYFSFAPATPLTELGQLPPQRPTTVARLHIINGPCIDCMPALKGRGHRGERELGRRDEARHGALAIMARGGARLHGANEVSAACPRVDYEASRKLLILQAYDSCKIVISLISRGRLHFG